MVDAEGPDDHRGHHMGDSTPTSHLDYCDLRMSRNKLLCCKTTKISVGFSPQHDLAYVEGYDIQNGCEKYHQETLQLLVIFAFKLI